MRFQKGQSGNPNGRPKKSQNLFDAEQACRGLAPDAFKTLCELLDSDNEAIRLKTAQMILDRAYGKPKQAIDMTTLEPPKAPDLFISFVGNESDAQNIKGYIPLEEFQKMKDENI